MRLFLMELFLVRPYLVLTTRMPPVVQAMPAHLCCPDDHAPHPYQNALDTLLK